MHIMKTSDQNYIITKFIYILFFVITGLIFTSCSKKVNFAISSVAPAAEGSVKIKKDKNNNYNIKLEVVNLAEPNRLTPPKEMYIVWMETESNGMVNIGKLGVSSGLVSKKLKSSLETISSFNPKSFIVTAEDNAAITYPSGQTILRTNTIYK